MASRKKSPAFYLVEWLDPRAHNDTEPADADLARCRTTGWLTSDEPDRIKLSQEYYTDEMTSTNTTWRSTTVILKSLIKRMKKVDLPF